VGPDALLPAEFKGAIKDAVEAAGGQVVEIVLVGDASSHVMLDECPLAVSIKQEEPLAANGVGIQDKAGVVSDPSRKPWEFGRLVSEGHRGAWGHLEKRHRGEGH
jgi:hypothetical protein